MDDRVALRRPGTQGVRFFECAAMRARALCGERGGTGIRTSQPKHFMACLKQFIDNAGADETRRAGNEYVH
jgi:hypothetical protein